MNKTKQPDKNKKKKSKTPKEKDYLIEVCFSGDYVTQTIVSAKNKKEALKRARNWCTEEIDVQVI